MTAAATKEKAEPKVYREVGDFKKKYAEALEAASIQAEHTQTEGWKQLYALHRKSIEDRRKELGTWLESLATTMKRGNMTDEDEKALGDIKKGSVELRAEISAFIRSAIDPVQEPVEACQRVISHWRGEAAGAESANPLLNRGMVAAMAEAISEVSKVTFDAETGMVEIKDAAPETK